MKIIDLSQTISPDLPVFPGDPQVTLNSVQKLDPDGWNMLRLSINTHDGTHLNMPIHAKEGGKTLDDYDLDSFCGLCCINEIRDDMGVIFTGEFTQDMFDAIIQHMPRFVGFDHQLSTDEEVRLEKELLQHDVVFFEGLTNLDQLPEEFTFCAMPLKIQAGDGSPVRAFAMIDD